MTFAKQLQAARAAAGLSQSKAAVPLIEAGILGSVRTLQNWELGRGEMLPAYKQAAALEALRPQKRSARRKRPDHGRARTWTTRSKPHEKSVSA